MRPASNIKFYYYPAVDLIDRKINVKFIELALKHEAETHRVSALISAANERMFKDKFKKSIGVDLTAPSMIAKPKQAQSKLPWLFARES